MHLIKAGFTGGRGRGGGLFKLSLSSKFYSMVGNVQFNKKNVDKYMNYSTLYDNILSYIAHTMKNYSSLQKSRWSVDGFLRCS